MNLDPLLPSRAKFDAESGFYDLDWSKDSRRKSSGSYYTPACLVECLLDFALQPILTDDCIDIDPVRRPFARYFRPPDGRPRFIGHAKIHKKRTNANLDSLPSIAVCDPACGTGYFLVAAAKRIAKHWAGMCSGRDDPPRDMVQKMLRHVVQHCIFGMDLDPDAAAICRINLLRAADGDRNTLAMLERHIPCGDSLFFDWEAEYPEVFARGGFDAVVGNPPFVNAIEGDISPETKRRLAESKELRGTADLAFHFVRLAHRLAAQNGTVGFVLPKTFLNAEAACGLRERLLRERPPTMIHVPRRAVYFPGASAYTCLLALGGERPCSISEDETPETASWRQGEIADSNWWRSVQIVLGNMEGLPPGEFVPLCKRFEAVASLTTAEAYAIKRYLRDGANVQGPKFVTTGLIDPNDCKWGREACRYLGAIYQHPRIVPDADLPRSLLIRLEKAARPKLLVAGLCNRIEAFLDTRGEYFGAVSTFTIYHPDDDVPSLESLGKWLNSAEASKILHAELGAASVGGGYMTLKKKTLQQFPVPECGSSG